MARQKQISFRIPPELYEKFSEKVVREGKQSGKVLEQLVTAYVEGNIPTGSNEVATDSSEIVTGSNEVGELKDEVEGLKQRLERLEQLVATGSNEVESNGSKAIATGSNEIATGSNEVESNDSNKVATGSNEVRSNDSNEVATGSNEVATEIKENYKAAIIKDEIAIKIANKLGTGVRTVLNRLQGTPKKRLNKIDKKILEEIENYRKLGYDI